MKAAAEMTAERGADASLFALMAFQKSDPIPVFDKSRIKSSES